LAFQTCSWFYFERNQAKPSEGTSTRLGHSLNFPKRPEQPLFTGEALWHSEHNRSAACGAWDCSGLSYQQLSQFGYLSPDGINHHPGRRLCPWYDRPVISRAASRHREHQQLLYHQQHTRIACRRALCAARSPHPLCSSAPISRGRCVTTFAPEGGDSLLRSSTFFAPGAPIQVFGGLKVKLW
jgi:hypothetical protein